MSAETVVAARLYYADAYRREFDARVIERLTWDGRPAVVLERTAFYPTSGGQPNDTGVLAGVRVVDVVEREADGAVVHVLASELPGDVVHGEIDWARRFDHMQQHTGQHILSQAFTIALEADTVGFHLGTEMSTIDLSRAPLSGEQLDQVEELANEVVFSDKPVDARFVDRKELGTLPLRKPPQVTGPIRIVEVAGFDWSPCGGTHCQRTGEVGMIKVVRAERRGAETRVYFLCGGRALNDYRRKNRLVLDLAARFSVGDWELADAVERLSEEARAYRKQARALQEQLLDYEAVALIASAEMLAGARVVRRAYPDRSVDEIRHLAQRLTAEPGIIALLGQGSAGEKAQLVFARSADLTHDMNALLRVACQAIGGGGGGRPNFAQGGGPDGARVEEALNVAWQKLK
ncbi:MAG: DHHA1 domain-containing protein [Anaerolineae bacterium]|nr:DHHA1 domain-containing protein [Anaerolineae bacterium]MDH7474617.1 DHHA1 domain-containing protein [Anaerolineae bacterium]